MNCCFFHLKRIPSSPWLYVVNADEHLRSKGRTGKDMSSTKLFTIIEKWAADELRSVNAQIEYLLTEATRKSGRIRTEKKTDEKAARK